MLLVGALHEWEIPPCKMPASTSLPPGRKRCTIRRFSAINKSEIRFAQIKVHAFPTARRKFGDVLLAHMKLAEDAILPGIFAGHAHGFGVKVECLHGRVAEFHRRNRQKCRSRCRCPKADCALSILAPGGRVLAGRNGSSDDCRCRSSALDPAPPPPWFFCGRRLIQLGLMSNFAPISMGLKCRFQDSDQSSRLTGRARMRAAPMFNPRDLIVWSPSVSAARLAEVQSARRRQ